MEDDELYSLDPTIPMKTSKQKLKTALARIEVLENDNAILLERLKRAESRAEAISNVGGVVAATRRHVEEEREEERMAAGTEEWLNKFAWTPDPKVVTEIAWIRDNGSLSPRWK